MLTGCFDEQKILFGQREDGNVHEIDLLVAREHEQNVNGAFEGA